MIKPLVTIAIPTYNRLNYLEKAVASALAQTYPNIEVIISQNPSEANVTESIRRWSETLLKQTSKVRYQENSQNIGMVANFNAVADAAKGEYIVFLPDDDRLLPDFVEKLVSQIKDNTILVFSNHYLLNSNGERIEVESQEWTKYYQRDLIPPGEVSCPEKWAWQNSIPVPSALIRTKDVQRLRFNENVDNADIELVVRLAQEEGKFVFVPEYLSEYRLHNQSSTAKGHCTEKLIPYLLPITVSPEAEPYKRQMLSTLMVHAVNRCLLQGDIETARNFFYSEYYTLIQRRTFKGLVQRICTNLPPLLGCQIYRLLHSIKMQTK